MAGRKGRPPVSPSRGRLNKSLRHEKSTQPLESSEQVSSVSVTEMSECHGIEEEEFHSVDVDQGSMHEIDDTLAPEENELQIIPWEMQDEVTAAAEIDEEKNIFMHRGADVLQTTHMFSCFECTPIPLCRLIPYARVRGLRDDLDGIKTAFAREGYMQEKGAFIVSLWTFKRDQTIATDDIKEKWDPLWIEINEEYELELKSKPRFADLSDRMFYVWEGNHRTLAWTEDIKEKFSTSKERHCRVLCTIIDPTKVPEIALYEHACFGGHSHTG
ncbi:hypothetical protein GOP47_0025500 [Adiantum capillus-veneris]|uniref:Uncharacterized protein n=1 Tax=Adiantum capillus-veneris TaxID=13818 RepID=A0A9D4U0B1_ADICA|nr:hypothetical protein GOP47_0025500 [Adiantum capillus-veneris]